MCMAISKVCTPEGVPYSSRCASAKGAQPPVHVASFSALRQECRMNIRQLGCR
jgi:hypothetical protein